MGSAVLRRKALCQLLTGRWSPQSTHTASEPKLPGALLLVAGRALHGFSENATCMAQWKLLPACLRKNGRLAPPFAGGGHLPDGGNRHGLHGVAVEAQRQTCTSAC